ncbi:MAG: ROK family protein [Bacteroidales bacterium]|nr:ROK family protein [Bacteroidales bacterium]
MEKLLCGVDIGGTKLSAGIVERDGTVRSKITVYDHTGKTEHQIVDQIAGLIWDLLKKNNLTEQDLEGIGTGFPGHIRYREGVTITTSNLPGFKNFPLRKAIQDYFSIPVKLDNDANAQAFCEYKYGAGRGYSDVIFLTISSGIGAGIILNNKLYRGMTGTAGEFGHTIIDPQSEYECTCGNRGCFMGCACGLTLPQRFRKKIEHGMKTTLPLPPDFDYSHVDGKLIKQGIDSNDPVSLAIADECADYTGTGVYNIFQIFNPPVIILGGGLMNLGDYYFNRIRLKFYELARDMLYDPVQIVKSEAGEDAGLIGAAALLLE